MNKRKESERERETKKYCVAIVVCSAVVGVSLRSRSSVVVPKAKFLAGVLLHFGLNLPLPLPLLHALVRVSLTLSPLVFFFK